MPVVGATAGDLPGVGIEAAQRTEKDLPVHAEQAAHADHLGDLFKLIAKSRSAGLSGNGAIVGLPTARKAFSTEIASVVTRLAPRISVKL